MYKGIAQFIQRRRDRGYAATLDPQDSGKRPEVPATIRKAFRNGKFVDGVIHGTTKGGFIVALGSFEAFCPGSEMYPRAQSDVLPRRAMRFQILRIGIRDVVLSRRRAARVEALGLARAAFQRRTELWGKIESIKPYGVFIDLGGADGLLHISNIWIDPRRLNDFLHEGTEIRVRVISIDPRSERIGLELPEVRDVRKLFKRSMNVLSTPGKQNSR